jgi:hypothetical protein
MNITQHLHIYNFHTSNFNFGGNNLKSLSIQPLVLVQHTDKVNPFLDKYRPIAFFSWKFPITQCNCSVTNLNY